jgi:uridine kinase
MIKDKISKEILARKNSDETVVVSICGAADLGKSFLSQEISESLRKLNFKVAHLTLDSYLSDRDIRNGKGLSGYQTESYDLENALNDLIALKSGNFIDLHPYNHTIGKSSSKSSRIDKSDIVIFDGLHSMHPSFSSFLDLNIFIYTQDENLKKIRKEADLIKRNYTKEFSNRISEKEFILYKTNIEPYRNKADYLMFLESKWNYNLTITGYNTVYK